MRMVRVYLDNVAASGRVLEDLVPESERDAVRRIESGHAAGRLKRVTSHESRREQSRTKDPAKLAKLEAAQQEVSAVATDYGALAELLGGSVAFTSGPTEAAETQGVLFRLVTAIGLEEGDAKHLVNAVGSDCQYFVTLDPDFLDRRAKLEAACRSIRIVRPSEVVVELAL
jgi:hypothetical protein